MQYRSTKVTANTTVSSTSSLFYGVLIVVGAGGGGGAALPVNIKVYDATSAVGASQVGEFVNPEPDTSKLYRSLNIVCKTGLRIECSAWTNVTVYVLHALGVIHGN